MSSLNITNSHLLTAYLEFDDKCAEIERYIQFMNNLDSGADNHLLAKDSHGYWSTKPITREVQKTIRASTYLLIYNLLESSMCDALDAIHLTLETESVDIQFVSKKLKRIIFSNLKKGLSEKSIDEIVNNNIDLRPIIMRHGYNKRELLSGNLDGDILKKLKVSMAFNLIQLVEKKEFIIQKLLKK